LVKFTYIRHLKFIGRIQCTEATAMVAESQQRMCEHTKDQGYYRYITDSDSELQQSIQILEYIVCNSCRRQGSTWRTSSPAVALRLLQLLITGLRCGPGAAGGSQSPFVAARLWGTASTC
jgi:hypothetical protein